MTSKAKAIEALNEIGELYKESYTDSYGHLKFFVKDEKGFQLIKAELAKPTLDDAIAVVENELKKLQDELPFNAIFKREYKFGIQALEYVLTALKGLKVEK